MSIMFNNRIVNSHDFKLALPISGVPRIGTAYVSVFYYPATKTLLVNNRGITEETSIRIMDEAIVRLEGSTVAVPVLDVEPKFPQTSQTVYVAVFYHTASNEISIHRCGLEPEGTVDLLRLGRNSLEHNHAIAK